MINLYITKRFKVKGDHGLVKFYKLKMENLRWRGAAKVRIHVVITAHKMGRPDLANSIVAFTY